MLDEAAARARLLAQLDPRCAWAVTHCQLSSDAQHFILWFNTEAYARTGDVSHALVGPGPCVVHRVTGVVELFGTGVDAEALLQDRRDAAEAGDRRWVVRPQRPAEATAIMQTRRWLGCPPGRARALHKGGPWFFGARRDVAELEALLQGAGIAVERALVDDVGDARPVPWPSTTEDTVRAALLANDEAR